MDGPRTRGGRAGLLADDRPLHAGVNLEARLEIRRGGERRWIVVSSAGGEAKGGENEGAENDARLHARNLQARLSAEVLEVLREVDEIF